jgi:zinc protease
MLDRKTPPPFVYSTSFDLIEPLHQRLVNNVDVYFVPGGNQEVIKVEMVFKAGRWFEEKTASSQFCANLISKGTNTKTSYQIAQIFDSYGAHLEINPGFDFVSISVYTVVKYLEPVIDLLVEILESPSYPEKEIVQHKSVIIQNLKINEEKTSYLASKAFRKKLFGEDHPYGKEAEVKNIELLEQKDIFKHYKACIKDPIVFVAGKISSDAGKIIADKLSRLPSGVQTQTGNRINEARFFEEHIEKEGSVQSSIRVGKKSLLRKHPDYADVVFVSHILGGYFGSRLMKNIREEKGLTYGIHASIQPLQHESFLLVGADVNKENVPIALTEIKKELRKLRLEKFPKDELETAKNHFIGSMQSEISTPFAHADKLKTIFLSGLSPDFYQQMILSVHNATTERISDVSEQYFHEDTFSYVAVG